MAHKILVVEDTKNLREIIAFMLKQRGFEVITAEEGNEALRKAKTEKPDLIVLDAMLPNITGFEICTELKADDQYKNIRILMLTAITQGTGKDDNYWKMKTRADGFLSKPFKARALLDEIEKLLNIAPSAAPAKQPN